MTIEEIERLATIYARRRRLLEAEVANANEEIAAARRRNLPAIKRHAGATAEAQSALLSAIASNPGLFAKPRTRLFDGVRVGFRKGKGRIDVADEAGTIRLIRRHLGEIAETLIKTRESLVKKALSNLPAADLKRIGVAVSETGDEPIAEATDGEIEKLVEALLGEDEGVEP